MSSFKAGDIVTCTDPLPPLRKGGIYTVKELFPHLPAALNLVELEGTSSRYFASRFELYSAPEDDPVNHPSHYTQYKGLEVIDLTEQMNFNRGNAVKYIARAGLKDPEAEIQDLDKAIWYIKREKARIQRV